MGKKRKKHKNDYYGNKGKSSQDSPVKAKKYLGQHFLKDEGIAKQIAETLSFTNYKNVIEIGPGTLEMREQVPEFSGMFQKEVAQRICAKEGSKTYGILRVDEENSR